MTEFAARSKVEVNMEVWIFNNQKKLKAYATHSFYVFDGPMV